MYCVIQEIKTKKEIKGHRKGIKAVKHIFNGVESNSYTMSLEFFKRPIKKAYKISIHKSYRENGKIKKKQWVIGTYEHYSLIEYGFELWRLGNKLEEMGITEDKLYDLIYMKLNPLIDKITKDFHNTEEYKVYKSYRDIIKTFNQREREFNQIYGSGYNECYDIFGNLTNKERLEQIKIEYKIKKDYEKKSKEAFRDWYSRNNESYYNYSSYQENISSNYNDEEKKLLKEAFKLLAMKYHPDRGGDTEKMAVINNLKEKIL